MNSKIIFSFIIFLFSTVLSAKEFCSPRLDNSYTFETHHVCKLESNCWLGLLPPEDTFKLIINNEVLENLSENNLYTKFDSFYVQLKNDPQVIIVSTKDLNQLDRPAQELCIEMGTYPEVLISTSAKWFFRTGSALFSIYFLLIVSLFLAFSLTIKRTPTAFALLSYSLISTVYLISFSEIPRLFFDPVLFSGGLHFPLRLSQDLSLIIVFFHFYKAYDYSLFFRKITLFYSAVLFCYMVMLIAGVRDYIFYERIIIFLAFLVAAPMAIGLYFALKVKDKIERKILIPFFSILFLFQLNDLMCFWGLWNTYFTVKLYIPLILMLTLFLYFRRLHSEAVSREVLEEKQIALNRFVHDLKSPLSAIKVVVQDEIKSSSSKSNLAKSAIDRIEEMANSLLASTLKTVSLSSIPLTSLIELVIDEINTSNPEIAFNKDFDREVFVLSDDVMLSRIITNLLNNAAESYEGLKPSIGISISESDSVIKITIKDSGKGMGIDTLNKARSGGFTTKKEGKGLGLSSSFKQIKDLGGSLEIFSKEKIGTTIELTIPRGDIPFWYHTDNLSKENFIEISSETTLNSFIFSQAKLMTGMIYVGRYTYEKNFFRYLEEKSVSIMRASELYIAEQSIHGSTYVLIDDDKYVRKAWELNMRDKGKDIRTFESFEDFMKQEKNFSRDSRLFLDRHIRGRDMIESVKKISSLGFVDITMITFDHSLTTNELGIKTSMNKLPPD